MFNGPALEHEAAFGHDKNYSNTCDGLRDISLREADGTSVAESPVESRNPFPRCHSCAMGKGKFHLLMKGERQCYRNLEKVCSPWSSLRGPPVQFTACICSGSPARGRRILHEGPVCGRCNDRGGIRDRGRGRRRRIWESGRRQAAPARPWDGIPGFRERS